MENDIFVDHNKKKNKSSNKLIDEIANIVSSCNGYMKCNCTKTGQVCNMCYKGEKE